MMGPETIRTLMHQSRIMRASIVPVCPTALAGLKRGADGNPLAVLPRGLRHRLGSGGADGGDGPTRGGCAARDGGISVEMVGHRGQTGGDAERWLEQLLVPPLMIEDHFFPNVVPRTGWVEARLGVRVFGFSLRVLSRGVLAMPGEAFCPGPNVRLVDQGPRGCS